MKEFPARRDISLPSAARFPRKYCLKRMNLWESTSVLSAFHCKIIRSNRKTRRRRFLWLCSRFRRLNKSGSFILVHEGHNLSMSCSASWFLWPTQLCHHMPQPPCDKRVFNINSLYRDCTSQSCPPLQSCFWAEKMSYPGLRAGFFFRVIRLREISISVWALKIFTLIQGLTQPWALCIVQELPTWIEIKENIEVIYTQINQWRKFGSQPVFYRYFIAP